MNAPSSDEKLSKKILVLGAGAWGTALAQNAIFAGHDVTLWARNPETVKRINEDHENAYLPGIKLDERLKATDQLADKSSSDFDLCLLVIPTQQIRYIMTEYGSLLDQNPLVICAKGIEQSSGQLVSDVIRESLPDVPLACLSGPSFADDLIKGLPTAVTIGADTLELATNLCKTLGSKSLRPYASDDLVGVQLGGALKNCLAIAVGVARGLGLGASAEASLTTRGFTEMVRLATCLGARKETLTGLSGLGDLMLSASSPQSRNFALGMAIGQEKKWPSKLAEGAFTVMIANKIGLQNNLELPILYMVAQLIEQTIQPKEAVEQLMSRSFKAEDA